MYYLMTNNDNFVEITGKKYINQIKRHQNDLCLAKLFIGVWRYYIITSFFFRNSLKLLR